MPPYRAPQEVPTVGTTTSTVIQHITSTHHPQHLQRGCVTDTTAASHQEALLEASESMAGTQAATEGLNVITAVILMRYAMIGACVSIMEAMIGGRGRQNLNMPPREGESLKLLELSN